MNRPETPAAPAAAPVRVVLPGHLCALVDAGGEVTLPVARPVTIGAVLDAVEAAYPPLRGTIRDHDAGARRPYVRFFACGEDFSLDPPGTALPPAVAEGREPLLIVGSIAGG